MNISAITPAPTVAPSSSSAGGALSLDGFYQLLAAEMQYTDPLGSDSSGGGGSGSNSSSYISELCTLTEVTAIQALTKVNNYSMATSMTGKTVSYNSTSTSATGRVTSTAVTGTVEAVDYSSDTPRLYVATTDSKGNTTGKWIDYTEVQTIYDNSTENYTNAASMVGKAVDYDSTSTDSTTGKSTTTTLKGQVTKIDMTGEVPLAYVQTTGTDGTKSGSWIGYTAIKTIYDGSTT